MSTTMTYELPWFRLNSRWTNKNRQVITTPTTETAAKAIDVSGLPDGAVIVSATLNVTTSSGYGGPAILDVQRIALSGNTENHIDFTSYVTGNGSWSFVFRFKDYGVDNLPDGSHYGEMVFTDITLVVVYDGQEPSEEEDPPEDLVPKPETTGICLYSPQTTDFSDNGYGLLRPSSCVVSEEAGGQYELRMVLPMLGDLWEYVEPEGIIKAPVPVISTEAFNMAGAEYWKVKATYGSAPVVSKIPTIKRVPSTSGYAAWSASTQYQGGDKCSYDGKVWQYVGVTVYPGIRTVAPGSASYWVDVTDYTTSRDTGKTLATLQRNEIFTKVDDVQEGWMRVKIADGTEGYMETKYAEYYAEADTYVPARTIRSQCFRIYRIEKDSRTRQMTVCARHISYDFGRVYLRKCEAQGVSVPTAISLITGATLESDNRQIITDITDETVDLDCSWENCITALLNPDTGIVAQLQARLIRDNEDFFILKDHHEDHGYRIRYGKNMKGVRWSVDTSDMVTRVIPHCKNVNGDDLMMIRQWADSPLIDEYPVVYTEALAVNCQEGKKGTCRGVEYEELTVEQCRYIMLDEAEKRFTDDHADEPEITIDVDMLMLGDTEEYKDYRDLEIVYMYDAVQVIHPLLHIDTTAYVTGYEYDAILRRYTSLTLKNARRKDQRTTAGFEIKNGSINLRKLSASTIDRLKDWSV